MIDLFILILLSFLLGNQIAIDSKKYSSVLYGVKRNWKIRIMFIILTILLILFSGLRTSYNDTQTYMYGYSLVDSSYINPFILFESYGGFELYQVFLKRFISTDPQILIFISSVIVNIIYMWFYAKYSKHFGWTILSYFVLGPYIFSMGGIKQILAMSISLFAIDNLLNNNYVKFVIWLLVAMTFHPYIICMFVLPLFTKEIWSKKIICIITVSVIASAFLEPLLSIVGFIGKEYTVIEMTSKTINPFRVIIELVPLILSLIYKNKLQQVNSKLFKLGINMMILNAFFISLGLFVNPIYFGRIGVYFTSLNAITIPMMLCTMYKNKENLVTNIWIYYLVYIVYFVLDLTKLGSISIFYDLFNHINFFL